MRTQSEYEANVLDIARSAYSKSGMEDLFNVCLCNLLNTKSLYQSVSISDTQFRQKFLSSEPYQKDVRLIDGVLSHLKFWAASVKSFAYTEASDYNSGQSYYQIRIPRTVKTWCKLCKSITIHNPIDSGECYSIKTMDRYIQVFHAEYECQDCKQSDVAFLIMREGIKLQLMGRSPIEIAVVSKEVASQLNDEETALFGDALMADKTGSELAAICLLRVALESYLRRITDNKDTDKMMSGEGLYEQYKKKLPGDFPVDRVESLGKIYNDLSAVMHTANVPVGCFQENYRKIGLFFNFLSLMPLKG